MNFRAAWRHVEYNYHEGGIRQLVHKVAYRLRQWLWSDAAWLIYRLDAAPPQRQAVLPLETTILAFDELVRLAYFKALAFPEGIRERLDSGAVCRGFFLDGELVNIAWITRGYLEMEPGVRVFESASVGIFDCYTLPAHRGKGVYTNSLVRLADMAAEGDASCALIGVDPGNIASIRGIERAGFQPFFRLTRVRRFGRESLRKEGFAPHSVSAHRGY